METSDKKDSKITKLMNRLSEAEAKNRHTKSQHTAALNAQEVEFRARLDITNADNGDAQVEILQAAVKN